MTYKRACIGMLWLLALVLLLGACSSVNQENPRITTQNGNASFSDWISAPSVFSDPIQEIPDPDDVLPPTRLLRNGVALLVPFASPPSITLTTPADGAAYLLHQVVLADYSCHHPAGLTASLTHGYTVTYTFDGLFEPVTDLASVKVKAEHLACDLGSSDNQVDEAAAGASGLQNLGGGHYQFNWKTPKSYANSCKTLHLDLGEGLTRTAKFKFVR